MRTPRPLTIAELRAHVLLNDTRRNSKSSKFAQIQKPETLCAKSTSGREKVTFAERVYWIDPKKLVAQCEDVGMGWISVGIVTMSWHFRYELKENLLVYAII